MIFYRPRWGRPSAKSNEKVGHDDVCRIVMGNLLDNGVKSSPCAGQKRPGEVACLVGFLDFKINFWYIQDGEDAQAQWKSRSKEGRGLTSTGSAIRSTVCASGKSLDKYAAIVSKG